jgi:hypothetical protein
MSIKLIDRYAFNARFLPAAAVLLPAGVAVASWLPQPGDLVSWGQLVMIGLSAGGAMLLAQLGRGPGKAKEPALFTSWGGQPTVAMLRHRDEQLDSHTKARYHRKLAALVPDSPAPTPEQETTDQAAADGIYASWVSYLLAMTRDLQQYRLLFAANIDYGFRRNLWGMKPAGVLLSSLGAVGALGRIAWSYRSTAVVDGVAIAVLAANVWLLVVWLHTIMPAWVKVTADAYARQLLAACDMLEAPVEQTPKAERIRRTA